MSGEGRQLCREPGPFERAITAHYDAGHAGQFVYCPTRMCRAAKADCGKNTQVSGASGQRAGGAPQ